ncbi:MAG: hypothetical protein ACRDST_22720 [Pseudonocardiaceae bacterium]
MLPEIPRDVALHPGPVASVYLEVSRDRDGAPHAGGQPDLTDDIGALLRFTNTQ